MRPSPLTEWACTKPCGSCQVHGLVAFRSIVLRPGTGWLAAAPSASSSHAEPWIVSRADGPAAVYRATLERICSEMGERPPIAFETDDPGTAQGLAAAELGVVVINELILAAPHPGVAVRPLAELVAMRRLAAATVAVAPLARGR